MRDPPADDFIPAAVIPEAIPTYEPEVVIPTFAPKDEPKPAKISVPKILKSDVPCNPVDEIRELAKKAFKTHVSKKKSHSKSHKSYSAPSAPQPMPYN